MTILEKIKFEEDWLSEVNLTMENIKIALAGIRATALESQRWIPVSERLPEEEGDYLVTFQLVNIRPIEVCYFNGDTWDKAGYEKVLAWMPLPKEYKEGEE